MSMEERGKVAGIVRGGREVWKVNRKDAYAVLDLTREGGILSVIRENWDGSTTAVSIYLTMDEIMLLKHGLNLAGIPKIKSSMLFKTTITWTNGTKTTISSLTDIVDLLLLQNISNMIKLTMERIMDV